MVKLLHKKVDENYIEKNQSIPGVFVCWFLSINAVVLYLEYDLKIDKKDLRLDSTHV